MTRVLVPSSLLASEGVEWCCVFLSEGDRLALVAVSLTQLLNKFRTLTCSLIVHVCSLNVLNSYPNFQLIINLNRLFHLECEHRLENAFPSALWDTLGALNGSQYGLHPS